MHNDIFVYTKSLESYFNPSEVEKMNLLPGKFSHSDRLLFSNRLKECDEFTQLQSKVPFLKDGLSKC